MNTLTGNISEINSSGNLSLVRIAVGDFQLSAIVIDTPDTSPLLQIRKAIRVLFKETEVVIGRSADVAVSLQNRIPGTVKRIEHGALLSKVVLTSSIGEIAAIITTRAVEQLELAEGQKAVALIKTNEIMLAE